MSAIVCPVACSMRPSRSTNLRPRRAAGGGPTFAFPAAMKPMRKRGALSMVRGSAPVVRGLARERGLVGDPRRQEDQHLGAVVVLRLVLEEEAEDGDVPEPGHLPVGQAGVGR